jgi:hypothetical protein
MSTTAIARLAALVALLPACSGDDSAAPEIVTETRTLLVGERIEATLVGGPDGSADIQLAAPAPVLSWDIHAHPDDGDTVTIAEGTGQQSVRYQLVPTEDSEWFLLLRNGGPTPVDVEVRIELDAMTWNGWR